MLLRGITNITHVSFGYIYFLNCDVLNYYCALLYRCPSCHAPTLGAFKALLFFDSYFGTLHCSEKMWPVCKPISFSWSDKKKTVQLLFENYMHLHKTFSFCRWLTGLTMPLAAVQRYVPASVRLMFSIFQVGPLCSTSLTLPFSYTLVQVKFGDGDPDASQNNCRFEPSSTVWSQLTFVNLARTKRNSNKLTNCIRNHEKNETFFHSTFTFS